MLQSGLSLSYQFPVEDIITAIRLSSFVGAIYATERVLDYMRQRFAEPKSGIHYPWLPNRSSAPGEYPALQSEFLSNNLGIEVDVENNEVLFGVAEQVYYAERLENIRPYMIRAWYEKEQQVQGWFEAGFAAHMLQRQLTQGRSRRGGRSPQSQLVRLKGISLKEIEANIRAGKYTKEIQ